MVRRRPRKRWRDLRRPPVIHLKKTGTHDGWAHVDPLEPHLRGFIFIDPRLTGRRFLEVLIHELIHHVFPSMEEDDVKRLGRYITLCLWAWGVRIDEERIKALVQGRDPDEV